MENGSIERVSVRLPPGFDPSRHHGALVKLIAQRHGDGFEIQHIDPVQRVAVATRQVAITEVTAAVRAKDSFEVRLARGTRPTDGDKVAAKLEDQHPGYYLTGFEPFLGRATLTKMSDEQARCRGASAVALGVKPWDVNVVARPDGGFRLVLPKSYVPSKHDEKLQEVAEIVGAVGWFVRTDPAKLTAEIIPSAPPTFPPFLAYPVKAKINRFRLGDDSWARIPLGMQLPHPGHETGESFFIDLEAAPHGLVSGISGAGKTVTINSFVAGVLARGAELVIVDLPSKAVDFMWAKRFCRPGGWGCDSLPAAVTAMSLVYEEGQRRAKVLKEHQVTKWTELPPGVSMPPIVVVVDELTGLFYPEKVPKGLPKDHSLVVEPQEINLQKAMLEKYIKKTAAELRFVGIKLLLSSQVSSTNTGVDTSLRLNLGNKILMGVNPTDNNRRLALSDAGRVPKVPGNVQADGKASRGVGVSELEGQEPAVFKSFYAATAELDVWLRGMGVPVTDHPEPTASQIARHTPSLEDTSESDRSGSRLDGGGWGAPDGRDAQEPHLKGAAAAAHQLRVEEQAAAARARVDADVIASLEDR